MHTVLEDGEAVCLRTIRPGDEARMREGIAKMSPQSRYLRFFSGARTPPDWVIERLLDADGDRHLAWGAIATDAPGEPAIGAVHVFREEDDPQCAEFSVAILDAWHGRGLGKLLTATILLDAQEEGIEAFHVDTLAENRRAIEFTLSLGGKAQARDGAPDGTTSGWMLDVAGALAVLKEECDPPGIAAVFAAFEG
ncbi:hypothetical protein ELI_08240 [Erythrobacter litoralis HTCC2594]|uniref:N-acetyltransferase domain-containing protein n=1 Tax=Erythrobacter litoralis (strain HTCC2594) TaxID=314225 RepID=Q2N9A1_ERYLH|nr:hypothetical protein ELI_08240 [Erythrobacter litoralis HTCC2594]